MGIYVHIPFCRSKCYYCGFYSVASTQLKKAYIAALGHEIQLRNLIIRLCTCYIRNY